MRYVFMIVVMSVLGTVHAQFKITDYQIFSKDGHSFVFFNESGEHIFFTTYKNHELVVEDLWTGDRERKNTIVGQIAAKKPTVFEVENLKKLDSFHLISKEYISEDSHITMRFMKGNSYEISDVSGVINIQGSYYMSKNRIVLSLTNSDGNYIGAVIQEERLRLILDGNVYNLTQKRI